MSDRTMYSPGSPEAVYETVRDGRFAPDRDSILLLDEIPVQRDIDMGFVEVLVDDALAREIEDPSGVAVADLHALLPPMIVRAHQPWHADLEPDRATRWAAYLQSDGVTLRNLVGASTHGELLAAEAEWVEARVLELHARPVAATLDLDHLSAVHARLFADVYPWAGETRTVNTDRGGGPSFAPWDEILDRWATIPAIVRDLGALPDLSRPDFLDATTTLYSTINGVHAFREGNGRAQRVWLDEFAHAAGYEIDWTRMSSLSNHGASLSALEEDLRPMRTMLDLMTDRLPSLDSQPAWAIGQPRLAQATPWVDGQGQVTEAAVERFNTTDCWQLAKALHDVTGWPMVAVGYEVEDAPGIGWSHLLVRRPDGKLVDVEGAHEEGPVLDRFGPIVEQDDDNLEADLIEIPVSGFEAMLHVDPVAADAAEVRQVARAVARREGVAVAPVRPSRTPRVRPAPVQHRVVDLRPPSTYGPRL